MTKCYKSSLCILAQVKLEAVLQPSGANDVYEEHGEHLLPEVVVGLKYDAQQALFRGDIRPAAVLLQRVVLVSAAHRVIHERHVDFKVAEQLGGGRRGDL